MNFSNEYVKGTRPTLSNLRRILREQRVVAGLRPAYVPSVLRRFSGVNGKRLVLHPTKGWRPA